MKPFTALTLLSFAGCVLSVAILLDEERQSDRLRAEVHSLTEQRDRWKRSSEQWAIRYQEAIRWHHEPPRELVEQGGGE